jgi:hypothetical protein
VAIHTFVRALRIVCLLFILFTFAEVKAAPGFSLRSAGAPTSGPDNVGYIGLGILNHDAGVAASDASSGQKPFFGEVYPELSFTGLFKVGDEWALSPVFHYGFIGKKSPDGHEKSSVSAFALRGCKNLFFNGFRVIAGPGLMLYQIKGSGGDVDLNNGSGTATFGTPSESHTSQLIYLELGAAYQISKYRLEMSLLTSNLFSSTKRAVSTVFSASMEIL